MSKNTHIDIIALFTTFVNNLNKFITKQIEFTKNELPEGSSATQQLILQHREGQCISICTIEQTALYGKSVVCSDAAACLADITVESSHI